MKSVSCSARSEPTGEIGPSNAALIRQPLEDAARHLTTEISAEYLHCACQGIAPGALRDLLVTLDRSDMAGAIAAVGYLRRFGHTSGMDGLLGAVAVLRHPAARRACTHAPSQAHERPASHSSR